MTCKENKFLSTGIFCKRFFIFFHNFEIIKTKKTHALDGNPPGRHIIDCDGNTVVCEGVFAGIYRVAALRFRFFIYILFLLNSTHIKFLQM